MKPKYKKEQNGVDDLILEAIKECKSNAELIHILQGELTNFLTLNDILEPFLQRVLTLTKQRLRRRGLIEIGFEGECKLVAELDSNDVNHIHGRRKGDQFGRLQTAIDFEHKHGGAERKSKAIQLYLLALNQEIEEMEIEKTEIEKGELK